MTVAENGLPSGWVSTLERRAPAVAREFLGDARRYLVDGSPDRVPRGREVETLKNLVFAYIDPSQHEAVLYDLAAASLDRPEPKVAHLGGLVALGAATVVGLVFARQRR